MLNDATTFTFDLTSNTLLFSHHCNQAYQNCMILKLTVFFYLYTVYKVFLVSIASTLTFDPQKQGPAHKVFLLSNATTFTFDPEKQ
jgi:hypothetical protein